jgi:hypothetical protein
MAYVVRKQVGFRLPVSVDEYLHSRAREQNATKTEVLIEAVNCLKEREIEALMAEGYREGAEAARVMAESSLAAGAETLPAW